MLLLCMYTFALEAMVRRVFCVGGPDMTVEDVAIELGLEPATICFGLRHIPNLNYHTIREAGLAYLLLTGTSEAEQIGFLANGNVWDVLRLDRLEYERLAIERYKLINFFRRDA